MTLVKLIKIYYAYNLIEEQIESLNIKFIFNRDIWMG